MAPEYRQDRITTALTYDIGAGQHPDRVVGDWCIMEATAYVAGEPWSEAPECICPVIAGFLRPRRARR